MEKVHLSITSDSAGRDFAQLLSKQLNAPIAESITAKEAMGLQFLLEVEDGILRLHSMFHRDQKPIILDLNRPRAEKGKDPLLRAIGPKAETVIDMTMGWGDDAIHLARHGLKVLAIERNAVVYAMVRNALDSVQDDELKKRFDIRNGDSIAVINQLNASADVLYLDPMYPERINSAAPKKALAVLRELVKDDDNSMALFVQANKSAKQRIVVKRPHYAEPIAAGKTGEIRSKLVRFDLYHPKRK